MTKSIFLTDVRAFPPYLVTIGSGRAVSVFARAVSSRAAFVP